jgi:hypothetical protein
MDMRGGGRNKNAHEPRAHGMENLKVQTTPRKL